MNASDPEQLARGVELAVFDIDGVMTDGRLYFTDSGEQIKAFHVRDGLGLKALMQHGIDVAVITARTSGALERRMQELGIERVMQGHRDKATALDRLLAAEGVEPAAVCYTGDDLVDWPAMGRCGLKCAPADADPWIREQADFVTSLPGGRGAVRQVCELLLDARGQLDAWRQQFQ
jgi:3-deoxy-D-manno-octulosonate 8-phosphate phosphatase (KDO 8-P phosphatase)